jgi:hypothetical protein
MSRPNKRFALAPFATSLPQLHDKDPGHEEQPGVEEQPTSLVKVTAQQLEIADEKRFASQEKSWFFSEPSSCVRPAESSGLNQMSWLDDTTTTLDVAMVDVHAECQLPPNKLLMQVTEKDDEENHSLRTSETSAQVPKIPDAVAEFLVGLQPSEIEVAKAEVREKYAHIRSQMLAESASAAELQFETAVGHLAAARLVSKRAIQLRTLAEERVARVQGLVAGIAESVHEAQVICSGETVDGEK